MGYFNPRPHAGATVISQSPDGGTGISIHAPMRGRPTKTWGKRGTAKISIHAPMRGRRAGPMYSPQHQKISIHAPMRGRRFTSRDPVSSTVFQSTPPCGGDSLFTVSIIKDWYFNPRPHAGATVRQGSQIPSDIPVFFSRRSVFRFPKPRYPVLFLSVCFPFALTAPWGLQGRKSFWLPGAGFCSDRYFPGCRTAGCRGLCR